MMDLLKISLLALTLFYVGGATCSTGAGCSEGGTASSPSLVQMKKSQGSMQTSMLEAGQDGMLEVNVISANELVDLLTHPEAPSTPTINASSPRLIAEEGDETNQSNGPFDCVAEGDETNPFDCVAEEDETQPEDFRSLPVCMYGGPGPLAPNDKTLGYVLHLPKTCPPEGGWPVLLYIHGGAFRSALARNMAFLGNFIPKNEVLEQAVVKGKVALAVLTYRLTSEAGRWKGGKSVTWPSQYEDLVASIKHITDNSQDKNLDASRLAVWGESAGAFLGAILATRGTKEEDLPIKAFVDFYGVMDLTKRDLRGKPAALNGPWYVVPGIVPGNVIYDNEQLDMPVADDNELMGFKLSLAVDNNKYAKILATANPFANAHPCVPPTYIAHGTNDPLVSAHQSKRFYKALRCQGVKVKKRFVVGGSHSMGPPLPSIVAAGGVPGGPGVPVEPMPIEKATKFILKKLLKKGKGKDKGKGKCEPKANCKKWQ